MAVTVKNGVFWDVMPCGSCKHRRFGASVRRLLVTASVVSSSPILVTLMKEATQRNIPEDAILHSC
jgi:hypothetical protein